MVAHIKVLLIIFCCLSFLVANTALAGVSYDPNDTFDDWAEMDPSTLYLATQSESPVVIAINVINWSLMFLGLISTGFILYAGLLWFFARENEEQVKKALDIIKGSMIGLLLVLMAYGIAYLVYEIIIAAQTNAWFNT